MLFYRSKKTHTQTPDDPEFPGYVVAIEIIIIVMAEQETDIDTSLADTITRVRETNLPYVSEAQTNASAATALLENLKQVNLRIRSEYEQRAQRLEQLIEEEARLNAANVELQARLDAINEQLATQRTMVQTQTSRIQQESELVRELQRIIAQETTRLQALTDEIQRTLVTGIDLSEQMSISEKTIFAGATDPTQPQQPQQILLNSLYTQIMSDWSTVWSALIGVRSGAPITTSPVTAFNEFVTLAGTNIDAFVQREQQQINRRLQETQNIQRQLREQIQQQPSNASLQILQQQLTDAAVNWETLAQLLPQQAQSSVKAVISGDKYKTLFEALQYITTQYDIVDDASKPTNYPSIAELLSNLDRLFTQRANLRPKSVFELWLLRKMRNTLSSVGNDMPDGIVSLPVPNTQDSAVSERVVDASSFMSLFRKYAKAVQPDNGDCVLLAQWLHTSRYSEQDTCNATYVQYTPRAANVEQWLTSPYSISSSSVLRSNDDDAMTM